MDGLEELFEDEASERPINSNLKIALKTLCDEAINLERLSKEQEEAIKLAKARIHQIKTLFIPDLMAEAGMGDITSLDDGTVISINPIISGSLPSSSALRDEALDISGSLPSSSALRDEALDIIENSGGGGIIKTQVSVYLGRDELGKLDEIQTALDALGVTAEVQKSIHPSTYKAFIRQAVETGQELPLDKLNVFVGRQAKIARKGSK